MIFSNSPKYKVNQVVHGVNKVSGVELQLWVIQKLMLSVLQVSIVALILH